MADEIVVNTGKGTLTLDELGQIQPGMARFMAEISPRISNCWHAAQARNWKLARYFLNEAVKTMQAAMLTRPKYEENMTTFITEQCDAVLTAIENNDLDAFNRTFDEMVEQANAYHELYDKPFIRYQVPKEAPTDLDLSWTGE